MPLAVDNDHPTGPDSPALNDTECIENVSDDDEEESIDQVPSNTTIYLLHYNMCILYSR